jgi:hypothetical protein
MSQKLNSEIAIIGKNSFHLVGQDRRGGKVGLGRADQAPLGRVGWWVRPTSPRSRVGD